MRWSKHHGQIPRVRSWRSCGATRSASSGSLRTEDGRLLGKPLRRARVTHFEGRVDGVVDASCRGRGRNGHFCDEPRRHVNVVVHRLEAPKFEICADDNSATRTRAVTARRAQSVRLKDESVCAAWPFLHGAEAAARRGGSVPDRRLFRAGVFAMSALVSGRHAAFATVAARRGPCPSTGPRRERSRQRRSSVLEVRRRSFMVYLWHHARRGRPRVAQSHVAPSACARAGSRRSAVLHCRGVARAARTAFVHAGRRGMAGSGARRRAAGTHSETHLATRRRRVDVAWRRARARLLDGRDRRRR